MAQADVVRGLTLDLPPSCIAFCPTQSNFFVVGTYYLHGKEQQEGDLREANNAGPLPGDRENTPPSPDVSAQKRTGSLILFQLEQDNITRVSTITTDFAILDIQWTLHPDKVGDDILAVATSTGLLAFYRLDAACQALVLSCVKRVCDSTTLVLSLTWHPFRPHVLGLTLSNGNVLLCECCNSSSAEGQLWSQDAVIAMHDIQQHGLEAWTMAFTTETAKTLSGGDDLVLQCSQIQDEGEDMQIEALWKDRKLHEAGVTAILPLSDILVVTGSYDDHIRFLSVPSVGRRQTLASLNLGGGVWRLKLLAREKADVVVPNNQKNMPEASESAPRQPCASLVLLASCMHAGARIVRLARSRNEKWEFEVLAKFEEHKSMNYGSDVQPEREAEGGSAGVRSIVSTSFYDRLLCLWKIDMGKIVPSN
ncbi:hypothetical protein AC579_2115 [Pseudocercospora musae]|uniref:Anaphase-promoting complex subunit 4 WD40 domain-containing protein n=1 Tax=Pseudocercospora musae TaxID=113226 RepID=A0A139GXX9_9PEZI|nr:hypothetical protein AC579_2115 [Pseudocercospora musae]